MRGRLGTLSHGADLRAERCRWWWQRLSKQQIPWLQTSSHTPRTSSVDCLNLCALVLSHSLSSLHSFLVLSLFSLSCFTTHHRVPSYLWCSFFGDKRLIIIWQLLTSFQMSNFFLSCLFVHVCTEFIHLYTAFWSVSWMCQIPACQANNQALSPCTYIPVNAIQCYQSKMCPSNV